MAGKLPDTPRCGCQPTGTGRVAWALDTPAEPVGWHAEKVRVTTEPETQVRVYRVECATDGNTGMTLHMLRHAQLTPRRAGAPGHADDGAPRL